MSWGCGEVKAGARHAGAEFSPTQAPARAELLLEGPGGPNRIDMIWHPDGAVLRGVVASWSQTRRALAAAGVLAGATPIHNQITVEPIAAIADAELAHRVRSALRHNAITAAYALRVEVRDGAVTLRGHLPKAGQRELAESTAGAVMGVRRVDAGSTAAEMPTPCAGAAIDGVHAALTHEPRLAGQPVQLVMEGAELALHGRVHTLASADAAMEIASTTCGARRVIHRLQVIPERPVTDAHLQQSIARALRWDATTEAFALTVSVRAGVVTLRGTVDTLYERNRAYRLASVAAGALDVHNELRVLGNPTPLGVGPGWGLGTGACGVWRWSAHPTALGSPAAVIACPRRLLEE